jgi:hypothetical protein
VLLKQCANSQKGEFFSALAGRISILCLSLHPIYPVTSYSCWVFEVGARPDALKVINTESNDASLNGKTNTIGYGL